MLGRHVASPRSVGGQEPDAAVRERWPVASLTFALLGGLADGKSKQPFYITLNDQDVFGFAGLWDSSTGADGVVIRSCTIVTMPANKLMTEIHNVKHRMPAILAKEDRDAWLTGTPEAAFSVIKQYPDTHMVATPVSTRVNTPKNNDAKLIEPIDASRQRAGQGGFQRQNGLGGDRRGIRSTRPPKGEHGLCVVPCDGQPRSSSRTRLVRS
jgi:hypothetical protein